jgi:hypothetical protein
MNFQCWYYATVFVQCATALGYKARRLGVGIHPAIKRPGNNGHIIAEIWSEEYRKWVVMDGDMNAYYKIGGIPAGALELHNIWISQQLHNVEYIQLTPVPAMVSRFSPEEKATEFVFGAYDVIDYYFQIKLSLRNNWFSSDAAIDTSTEPVAIALVDKVHPDYAEKAGKVIDKVLWLDNADMAVAMNSL